MATEYFFIHVPLQVNPDRYTPEASECARNLVNILSRNCRG